MPHRRYQVPLFPRLRIPVAAALFHALRRGYDGKSLRADLAAGAVVGIVALPLSMALAIASGVPPQHGLYTAIVAGGLIALLGGSAVNVSGPTAAFVVLLAPVSAKYGLAGLALASAMAGLILIAMGAARMGRFLQFVPYPVTTGFTAGIGVVIATLQLPDFFGLSLGGHPDGYFARVAATARALPDLHWHDLSVGLVTLALLIGFPRLTKRVPAPLVAVGAAAALSYACAHYWPSFDVATIASRFGEIPRSAPSFAWPWDLSGPQLASGGPTHLTLSLGLIEDLAGPAFTIAILGAIESLLSAVVADGMARTEHDPDAELIGQGLGNLVAPFFGGFAATGAIARTATNVRAGGRTPVAAAAHALFLLAAMLALAPLLGYLPMAALAALLLLVAWNMSDVKHFRHVLAIAPRSDVAVLLACFSLTVIFDMVVAVSIGIVLAALLFMRRMAEITGARLAEGEHARLDRPLPSGVVLYEIAGPLFFGAAEKAMAALDTVAGRARAVILDIEAVPSMDMTGLVALESALETLRAERAFVVIAGVQAQPAEVLARAGVTPRHGHLALCGSVDEAVAIVERELGIRDKIEPAPPRDAPATGRT